MTYSVETKKLCHRFSHESMLLKDIDIQVPQGSIYGFIGKNGAGKTTTLKLILGLLELQEGEILIFGKKLKEDRISILQEIGSLIESPSFYSHLSARDNLRILQKLYQCPIERIDTVLKLLDLEDTGKKKVRQFSLGMKQRLSIAIALLHEPKLLILDEPTNGLDPNGIIEMRELLRGINATLGTTIIISSHLLAEIEKIVSHLAIINQGELVFQGSFEDLKLKQKEISSIKITSNDPAKVKQLLADKGLAGSITGLTFTLGNMPLPDLAGLIKHLVAHDIEIYQVMNEAMDLESIFMNLTKNGVVHGV